MILLSNEVLAEVTAFFKLFDLGALLLTSRRFCILTATAVDRITAFYVFQLALSPVDDPVRLSLFAWHYETVDDVQVTEHIDVPAGLLEVALSNCVLDALFLFCWDHPSGCVARAAGEQAANFAVPYITLDAKCFTDVEDLLSFLAPFWQLEAVGIADVEAKFRRNELRNALRQNGITLSYIKQKKSNVWKQKLRRLTGSVAKRVRRILP